MPAPSTTDAIAEAGRRHDAGDWSGAIDVLIEANRRHRDGPLEVALTELRHRAFTSIAANPDAPRVEPSTQPPPVGPSGLPEGDFATLAAADIRASLLANGSLLVREALSAELVQRIREQIDSAIEASLHPDSADAATWRPLAIRDDVRDAMRTPPRPLRRSFVHEAGGALLADAPQAMFELLEIFESLGLHEMVGEYLGSRPVMSAHKSTLRRVPLSAVGGWHQDGAFLGADVRAINIWIALSECGIDAPGLDIVPRRLDHIVETGTQGSYFDWAVSDLLIDEVASDHPVVRPHFAAGDILIFDEMLLHRTAVSPDMHLDRYAIEFWCFSAASYPEGQVPLVW